MQSINSQCDGWSAYVCLEQFFGEFNTPSIHPAFHHPFWVRVHDGQKPDHIFILIRIANIVKISCDISQNRIYDTSRFFTFYAFDNLNGFIDCSGMWNFIQKHDLIECDAHRIFYRSHAFVKFTMIKSGQDPIQF